MTDRWTDWLERAKARFGNSDPVASAKPYAHVPPSVSDFELMVEGKLEAGYTRKEAISDVAGFFGYRYPKAYFNALLKASQRVS